MGAWNGTTARKCELIAAARSSGYYLDQGGQLGYYLDACELG